MIEGKDDMIEAMVKEKNDMIEEKETMVKEKNDMIEKKDAIIKEKETLLKEQIKEKEAEILKRDIKVTNVLIDLNQRSG